MAPISLRARRVSSPQRHGGTSAVTTALLCGAGYIIVISSVLAISAGFLSTTLNYYLGWNVPWIIFSVLLTAGAVVMTIRGVGVSTKLAGLFFAFEMVVLIVVSVAGDWQPGSRWRFTCLSAGRTPRPWLRRPPTRDATYRAQCSCPSP